MNYIFRLRAAGKPVHSLDTKNKMSQTICDNPHESGRLVDYKKRKKQVLKRYVYNNAM